MQLYDYERKHLEQLRAHLPECCVLLKKNGDFPLNEAGKLAVYGSGARYTIKGGTGSGEVNSRYFTTVEEGLLQAGFTITTNDWLDAYDKVQEEAYVNFCRTIKQRAKENHTNTIIEGMGAVMPQPEYALPLNGEGETAVYVVSRISGEGNDRRTEAGDVFLNESEKRDILMLNSQYDKFMLVLNVGGPVDLTPVKNVDNILVLSQLGVETGAALADILLGKAYPSGKLATTWSSWEEYCSIGEFGDKDDTRYKEGIYVGYRYFDSVSKRAQYPFGYGLGYTDFSIGKCSISAEGTRVTVEADVENTGAFPGKEVVQIYVSSPQGKLDQPYQALAAFAKTEEVAAGQTCNVRLSFDMAELASYDTEEAAYILEKGYYVVRIGNSSVDTKVCGILLLDDTVIVCQLKNRCGQPDFTDWKPETVVGNTLEVVEKILDGSLPYAEVITIPVDAFEMETISYEREYEIAEAVKGLSDEELVYCNVGNFGKGGLVSVIGNAAKQVAGAAGESTSRLKEQGVPVLVMADGPAGVRISQKYFKDEKGVHGLEPALPKSLLEFMPGPMKWLLGRAPKIPRGAEVKDQYTTAIPIGTAIAQSWNVDFAKMCGDIVGTEMKMFGVHLWLAPALNIHRSILCGRNFEYFSEDPLLSGKFAAALTKGVQAHEGCGVTIKHFAANNQENCRYSNNSQVSERALREIYLKGFEICVKEAKPLALMTSYNLINGVHTSDLKDLTENILRCEWGYEGLVMTDWVTGQGVLSKEAKYAPPHAGKAAAAGNDLFMPGAKRDYAEILEALQNGILSRKQLEISATRVYNMSRCLVEKQGK